MSEQQGDRRDDGLASGDELGRDPPAPSASGSAGGELARDVGSRDEEKAADGGEPESTRVTKQDKVQPATSSRSDDEGAQR